MQKLFVGQLGTVLQCDTSDGTVLLGFGHENENTAWFSARDVARVPQAGALSGGAIEEDTIQEADIEVGNAETERVKGSAEAVEGDCEGSCEGSSEGEVQRQLRAKFDAIDADGSGDVDKEELAKALLEDADLTTRLRAAGLNPEWYVLDQIDTDSNGTLTWEEFSAALQQTPESSAPHNSTEDSEVASSGAEAP